MSDPETRQKGAEKRKRNPIARELFKGPFAVKVHNPKKEKYVRIKLDPREIELEEEDE